MTHDELKKYRIYIAKIKAFKQITDESEVTTKGKNPTEDQAVFLLSQKERNELELKRSITCADKIRGFIDSCPSDITRTFMQLRYIAGMEVKEAANQMGYDDKYLINLQSDYLKTSHPM